MIKPLAVVSWALIRHWSQWEQLRHFMSTRLKMISVLRHVDLTLQLAALLRAQGTGSHRDHTSSMPAQCYWFELCILSSYSRVTELRSWSWISNPQATVLQVSLYLHFYPRHHLSWELFSTQDFRVLCSWHFTIPVTTSQTMTEILIWASRLSCAVCSLLAHVYRNTFYPSKIISFEISNCNFILTTILHR